MLVVHNALVNFYKVSTYICTAIHSGNMQHMTSAYHVVISYSFMACYRWIS